MDNFYLKIIAIILIVIIIIVLNVFIIGACTFHGTIITCTTIKTSGFKITCF